MFSLSSSTLVSFSCWSAPPLYLHSFPTRRSSDLYQRYSTNLALAELDRLPPGLRRAGRGRRLPAARRRRPRDRKSTRLNSSHVKISYAVFCLKKKRK